jgi:hypothetical protein
LDERGRTVLALQLDGACLEDSTGIQGEQEEEEEDDDVLNEGESGATPPSHGAPETAAKGKARPAEAVPGASRGNLTEKEGRATGEETRSLQ